MEITTTISSVVTPDTAHTHHPECMRDHTPRWFVFKSESPKGGYGEADCLDCMLYEMEDTAFDSVVAAYETTPDPNFDYGAVDDASAWTVATVLAAEADALDAGGSATVRRTVRAA